MTFQVPWATRWMCLLVAARFALNVGLFGAGRATFTAAMMGLACACWLAAFAASFITLRIDATGVSRHWHRQRCLVWDDIDRIATFGAWARIVPLAGRSMIVPIGLFRAPNRTRLSNARLPLALDEHGLPAPAVG
jgi:hypothetical protein